MAEQQLSEAGKQELEAGKKAKEESMAEFAKRTQGRPTPTQEENDRAALGEHISQHEADGGEPDPGDVSTRHMTSHTGGGYQTRQAKPAAPPQHRPPQQSS